MATGIVRIAIVFALLAPALLARAEDMAAGPYLPGGYGLIVPEARFYNGERIPYFALYPPVYYSLPVPRTYGYSPFAYPPGTMTPELLEPEIKVYEGPTKPAGGLREGKRARVAVAPLRLHNPYLAKSEDSAEASLPLAARPQPAKPLVLFPAAVGQAQQ